MADKKIKVKKVIEKPTEIMLIIKQLKPKERRLVGALLYLHDQSMLNYASGQTEPTYVNALKIIKMCKKVINKRTKKEDLTTK